MKPMPFPEIPMPACGVPVSVLKEARMRLESARIFMATGAHERACRELDAAIAVLKRAIDQDTTNVGKAK